MKCICIKNCEPYFRIGDKYTVYYKLDANKFHYNIDGHYLTEDEFSKYFINLREHNLDTILGNEL